MGQDKAGQVGSGRCTDLADLAKEPRSFPASAPFCAALELGVSHMTLSLSSSIGEVGVIFQLPPPCARIKLLRAGLVPGFLGIIVVIAMAKTFPSAKNFTSHKPQFPGLRLRGVNNMACETSQL